MKQNARKVLLGFLKGLEKVDPTFCMLGARKACHPKISETHSVEPSICRLCLKTCQFMTCCHPGLTYFLCTSLLDDNRSWFQTKPVD